MNRKIKDFEKQHEVTKNCSKFSNCSLYVPGSEFKYTRKRSIQYGYYILHYLNLMITLLIIKCCFFLISIKIITENFLKF